MSLIVLNCFVLTGCHAGSAPREFAPDGTVIQQAMQGELRQHYRKLSDSISASPPTLQLKNIQVDQLDSFFLKRLPVYHVQGTYDLELEFPSQTKRRPKNPFELYLQRQTEGKTWRSLKKIPLGWQSYPVRD
ncbi:hypothetical protein [[Leptolyngbya] sp. PCC 7376]|uniref:hypothetical protein n=1 Tax=[Leptolyngbya] sp. PCC 7376 TaxID=111781 RepID=UPI0002DD252D|nr:hypothetical protein [[Leptolyngbya] sp. PCC 7376]